MPEGIWTQFHSGVSPHSWRRVYCRHPGLAQVENLLNDPLSTIGCLVDTHVTIQGAFFKESSQSSSIEFPLLLLCLNPISRSRRRTAHTFSDRLSIYSRRIPWLSLALSVPCCGKKSHASKTLVCSMWSYHTGHSVTFSPNSAAISKKALTAFHQRFAPSFWP